MSGLQVVSLCSIGRREHLARQIEGVRRWGPQWQHRTALIGELAFEVPGSQVIDLTASSDSGRVNLAAARNVVGDEAVRSGAEVIVFLDADCIPGPGLLSGYRAALGREPWGVHAGAVTYLTAEGTPDLALLDELTDPHPARPNPPAGQLRRAATDEYVLFWSLSFALTATTWRRVREDFGGFCEEFAGYGGEDTDFGLNLRRTGVPLWWVGGAHAHHQWHPVSNPPVEHLDDILVNAEVFHRRWGRWPMEGWLAGFEALGLAYFDGERWVRR